MTMLDDQPLDQQSQRVNTAANEGGAAKPSAALPSMFQAEHTRKFALMSVIIAFLVSALGLTLAWRQGVFEKSVALKFVTTSGQNLSRGMPILFKGFKVGYLDALELEGDGRITAEVVFKEKHAGFVTVGSSLRVSKDKIVTSELVLEPGPANAARMTEGQEIALKTDGGIDALEKRIFDRIDPVLNNLNTLISRLSDPNIGVPPAVDAVRVSVENSKATFTQLNVTLAQATKTLAALNLRAADPKIDSILVDADKTLVGLANNTESFNKTLAGITSNTESFNKTLAGVSSNTESVNKTLAGLTSNTEQINKTLEASRQLMDTAQQLMINTQKSADGTSKEVTESLKQMQRVLAETVLLMEDMRRSTLGRWLVAPRKNENFGAPNEPQTPRAPGGLIP
jgi:ABC-type transporter Mla subunit MlaD